MATSPLTDQEQNALKSLLNNVRELLNVAVIARDEKTGEIKQCRVGDVSHHRISDLDTAYRAFRDLRIQRIMNGDIL